MKNFRVLPGVLIVLALLGASCPKKSMPMPKVMPPAAPKRVYDPVYGVSIVVPEDWQITFRNGNPFLFAVAPGAGPTGPMVNVVTEQISQRLTPYDYLQANIPTMRLSLKGMEVVRYGIDVKDGINIAWLQYTYPRGKEKMEAVSFAQTIDYQAYVVTGVASAADYKNVEPLLRSIGQSLRVETRR